MRKILPLAFAIIAILALPIVALATGPSTSWTHACTDTNTTCQVGNNDFQADTRTSNTQYTSSIVVTTTTASRGGIYLNRSSVALTSTSAVTNLDVNGKFYIDLSANVNLPSIYPINGTLGQKILLHAANGAGTNTMIFVDNASTLSLGSNRTMTEGNNSIMELICTTGGARPQWAMSEFQAN